MNRRIVCVSNRVMSPRSAAQAGGVAVAISEMLKSRRGIWFGWSGDLVEPEAVAIHTERIGRNGSALMTMDLTPADHEAYYLGYSNSVLWPVFHNRVDLAQFEAGYFAVYRDVNKRFALALAAHLEPDDLVWVHDYHLIPLATELRALGVKNPIGFFLHIPFPPSQTFLTIPEHLELAHAFAAYDLVGLQTMADVANMIDYLEHGAPGRLTSDGRMRVGDRMVSIASFPIGIDPQSFAKHRDELPVIRQNAALRRIIGVDRLDYTKGLPQKFRAYGRFLEKYPEQVGSIVLTQIAAPTRDSVEAYSDIRRELESLAGAINGAHGTLDWVPIHYVNRSTSRRKLAQVYRDSRVAMVTPLRDGMNLVAKEYVAAQDPLDPGVLILSRFAGAAERMQGALIVNPYNTEEMADAIEMALGMPRAERRQRHAELLAAVLDTNVSRWRDSFISALAAEPLRRSDLEPVSSNCGIRIDGKLEELGSLPPTPPRVAS